MKTSPVSGVKITIVPCDHCGETPTNEQIEKAVEWCRREIEDQICSVCGEKQQLVAATLYHYKEGGQERWGTRATEGETMLVFQEMTGLSTVRIRLHPKCAMKAMPHVNWGFSF